VSGTVSSALCGAIGQVRGVGRSRKGMAYGHRRLAPMRPVIVPLLDRLLQPLRVPSNFKLRWHTAMVTETLSHSLREDCPKRPADMSMGRSYPTSMSRGGRSDAEHSAAQFPVQRLVKTVRFPTHHPTLVHPPREHTQGGQLLKGFLLAPARPGRARRDCESSSASQAQDAAGRHSWS
jgi:hypothetical protein